MPSFRADLTVYSTFFNDTKKNLEEKKNGDAQSSLITVFPKRNTVSYKHINHLIAFHAKLDQYILVSMQYSLS